MKKSLCGHGIARECGVLTVVARGWVEYAVRALQDMSVSMCQVPSSGTRGRHTSRRRDERAGALARLLGYLWLECVVSTVHVEKMLRRMLLFASRIFS